MTLKKCENARRVAASLADTMLMIPTGHPEELGLVLYSLIIKASLALRHVAAILWLLQIIYAYFLCLIETLTS